jgi:hypothetical protein
VSRKTAKDCAHQQAATRLPSKIPAFEVNRKTLSYNSKMPSFFRSLALYALLAGALVAQVTNAYPQPALVRSEDAAIPHDTITTEPISMVRSIEDDGDLYQRSKPLKIAKEPTKSYSCPATNNYGSNTYTSGQLKAAFVKAAQYANDGKQIGDSWFAA